jgi:uncharacterized protein involved in exopolysaccharide biosynthesis
MTEPYSQNVNVVNPDEIDFRELFAAIRAGKWIIIGTTFVFLVAAVIYALILPNIYKSDVILAPTTENSGLKVPDQLGGLAALAGVNIGNGVGDKTVLALEILKSREFLGRFITENDLFIPIIAAKGWDRANDKLIIDADIYNESTKEWVRDVEEPFKPKPSVLETIEEFDESYSVSKDKESGIVTLSVQHYSPFLAKQMADKLVIAINEDMRQRELNEAEKSIEYLNQKIADTNLSDVRTMLFSLIEEQTKVVMLANVREEYVFKTVDRAVVAEKKSKPARALICIVAMMLGFMLSTLVVLVRYFKKSNQLT